MSFDHVYSKKIFRHAKNPKHSLVLESATHILEADNPSCGDALKLYIEIDENDVLQKLTWQGDGCALSQAAASMFCDQYAGVALSELETITEDDWLSQFDTMISPARLKCALLPLTCIHDNTQILKK